MTPCIELSLRNRIVVRFFTVLLLLVNCPIAHSSASHPQQADEMAVFLDDPVAAFEKAVSDRVSEYRKRFIGNLETLGKEFQADGELESLLAVQAEIARVKTEGSISTENLVEEPKALSEQQVIFKEQAEAASDVVAGELLKKLNERVIALTKDGKVEDAKKYLSVVKTIETLQKAKKPEEQEEELEWISQDAAYRTSSVHQAFTPRPSFVSCEDTPPSGFAFHTQSAGGEFVEIDLGEVRTVRKVWILNRQAPGATKREMQGVWDTAVGLQLKLSTRQTSSGKKIWTAKTGEMEYEIDVSGVQTRYVRLEQPTRKPIHLSQIKVFAEPLDEEPKKEEPKKEESKK